MVRLRPNELRDLTRFIYDFNYIMVRLRQGTFDACYAFAEFQFHYGAIKTEFGQQLASCYKLFQFHYGAIKTIIRRLDHFLLRISIPLWCD